ncbi:MAG: hypothetical protein ABIJ81_00850 [Patescibacteria group bacterium]
MIKRGFTLMEVMVVIGILILLVIIGIPALRIGQQSTEVRADARTLLNDLRLTQQLTVGEQTTHLIKIFTATPHKYHLVKREGSDTVIKERLLTSGITWQNSGGFTNNEIIFTTTGAVVEAGTVILQNTAAKTVSVEIKPSGYVRVN